MNPKLKEAIEHGKALSTKRRLDELRQQEAEQRQLKEKEEREIQRVYDFYVTQGRIFDLIRSAVGEGKKQVFVKNASQAAATAMNRVEGLLATYMPGEDVHEPPTVLVVWEDV